MPYGGSAWKGLWITMQKIRIGILGAADIAYRRFLPALRKTENFIFAGVAVASESGKARAQRIADEFGGRIYVGYENLLRERDIDAVYIPLPPSLHYTWADRALNMGQKLVAQGKFSEAEEAFREAVSYYRDEHRLFQMIAKCFIDADQPRRAIDYLRKALEIEPDNEPARLMLEEASSSGN